LPTEASGPATQTDRCRKDYYTSGGGNQSVVIYITLKKVKHWWTTSVEKDKALRPPKHTETDESTKRPMFSASSDLD
jgi:hypothetical protein